MILQRLDSRVLKVRRSVMLMTPRILIADDSPCIRDLMTIILSSCGYAVTVAEDGQAAWEQISQDPPNMVVLDIEMPRLDGCEVCRLIKDRPATRDIPVLIVSGCKETASRALSAGADAFLNKPFCLEDLQGQVDALLSSATMAATALRS